MASPTHVASFNSLSNLGSGIGNYIGYKNE